MITVRRLIAGLGIAAAAGVIVAAAFTLVVARTIPPLDQLLTRSAERIGPRVTVPFGDLPPVLIQALVAAEDRSFYDHPGIDPVAIVRAALADIRAGRIVQGGSTITEQVAKNILPPHRPDLMQKFRQAIVAALLEHRFSKNQILQFYFNRVYFGQGAYGIEAASRRYFGKPAAELTPFEAAMLVGLLPAPSRFNPVRDRSLAEERARQILEDMVDAGLLTREQRAHIVAAAQHHGQPY